MTRPDVMALTAAAWRKKITAELADEICVLSECPELAEDDSHEALAKFGRLVFEKRRANRRPWTLFDTLQAETMNQPAGKPAR